MDNFDLTRIIGATFIFGTPVMIILIACLFNYLNKKGQYHLAEVMIINGQELPDSFFEKKNNMESSIKLLKNGLTFIAIGIGTALLGWNMNETNLLAIASVPTLIGLAYILVSFIVRKKEKQQEASESTVEK